VAKSSQRDCRVLSKSFYGHSVLLHDGSIFYNWRVTSIFIIGFSKSSIIISDSNNNFVKESRWKWIVDTSF